MIATSETGSQILTADGTPLRVALQRTLRLRKIKLFLLVLPLLTFIVITYALPILDMLMRSVDNSIVADTLPRTVDKLSDWDPETSPLPDEEVYAALALDLRAAVQAKKHTRLGSRLNYEKTGTSSLLRKTGRQIKRWDLQADAQFKEKFAEIDPNWASPELWRVIKTLAPRYTASYFLHAADLRQVDGEIRLRDESERIHIVLLGRTLGMSLLIAMFCLLLGYPVAFLLAALPLRKASFLLILVLLPFWTSFLVRTSAWKVLLQNEGVINDLFVALGLVDTSDRLQLINNQFGTIIAMTHILLPFMILPLYSVMRSIQPSYVRAAKSLGATPWTAFRRVYFPLSLPGIGAGLILVFILAIGYYITPEIVGGTTGTFISNRIAYHISSSLNWGLGAALGSILLFVVLALYYIYDRLFGIDNIKLG